MTWETYNWLYLKDICLFNLGKKVDQSFTLNATSDYVLFLL